MNMRFLFPVAVVLLAFSVSFGSSSNAATQVRFTAKDMRECIFKGCADKSWRPVDVDANTVEATVVVRDKHVVVVLISYTAESYSINYKSSINMKYKPNTDGTFSIHRNYYNWVNNLDQAIQKHAPLKKL